jgi:hypothetical protein
MDELMKCGKFEIKKINCRLGCDTHKNIRAIGLKTAQENNDKYEQWVTCSKSVVVALCYPGVSPDNDLFLPQGDLSLLEELRTTATKA